MLFGSIFFLRLYKATADLDGVELVFADAPEQYLLAPGIGIVIPLSIPLELTAVVT